MHDAQHSSASVFTSCLSRRRALLGVGGLGLALAGSRAGTARAGQATTPAANTAADQSSAMADLGASLPTTAARLADAAERGGGGQAYASHRGTVVANLAWGTTPSGAEIATESLVPWASACKPTTCVAVMRLLEAGRLGIDDPVTNYIPEFGVNGKDGVLVRHLLTHTAHLGGYDGPVAAARESWEQTIAKIVAAPMEAPQGARAGLPRARAAGSVQTSPAPTPGTDPVYNPPGIWILGEILRRLHDAPFTELIRDEVFLPVGMTDSWNGMPDDRFRSYGDRIVAGVGRMNAPQVQVEAADTPNPAGGGVGPTRNLALFYEMVLNGGEIGGTRLLRAETIEEMTSLQATDGGLFAWGLGFNLNATAAEATGAQMPPPRGRAGDPAGSRLRYGRHASPRAFGHPGASGMIAFADPDHGLVVGLIGAGTDIIDAVYEDLGLA